MNATPQITISRLNTELVSVPIVGTAPLIQHRWSEKARRQMLDSMQGKKKMKEPKDPEADYRAAMYLMDDGEPGVPTLAFKAATVRAASYFGKDVAMTTLRQCLFFVGETTKAGDLLTRLDSYTDPVMREDVMRVGMGTDLRYRPQFEDWSATLTIRVVSSMLSRESLLSLVEAGGMGVGVGEWRPQRSGQFGTYEIDGTRDVEVLES